MNRLKAVHSIFTAFRLANSLLSTKLSTTRSVFTQVNQNSNFYEQSPLPDQSHASFLRANSDFRAFDFTLKPSSIVDLILAFDWCTELENDLEISTRCFAHATTVYVLHNLDKEPRKALDFFNWVCEKKGFRPNSLVYSLLVRILAMNKTTEQFWITMRKMRKQGFYLDEETYMTIKYYFEVAEMATDVTQLKIFYTKMLEENAMGSVLREVVDIILESEWNSKIEKELEDLKIAFSENSVLRALKLLQAYPSKTLKFFHWVHDCSGFQHNTVTYNVLARVLARGDAIGEFWSVVEEMKSAGHEMDYDTYVKISRRFQAKNLIGAAVKLCEHMMEGLYRPSIQDCTMLVWNIAVSHSPDLDLMYRVIKKYEATGYTLDRACYVGIYRSLVSAGRFDEAEEILQVMRTRGWELDKITYDQMVFGLCKAKRLEEAHHVLDEMEKHGVLPDIITWTILIQGHFDGKEFDKALHCFGKMKEKNCNADAFLLDVLINGFVDQNEIDGAYKMLTETIDSANLVPLQATLQLLADRLLIVREFKMSLNLLHLMRKHSYPVSEIPFVQYISKFGTAEDALEFVKALGLKGYKSLEAYLRLFQAFEEEGRHLEAKDLLSRCG